MNNEIKFQEIEIFGQAGLFSNARVDRRIIPKGMYCYDLRGSDYDPGLPISLEKSVVVNHAGCVITAKPIDFNGNNFKALKEDFNFTGNWCTLKEFCKKNDVPLRQCSQYER